MSLETGLLAADSFASPRRVGLAACFVSLCVVIKAFSSGLRNSSTVAEGRTKLPLGTYEDETILLSHPDGRHNLFHRARELWPFGHISLDNTALGKSQHLAIPSSTVIGTRYFRHGLPRSTMVSKAERNTDSWDKPSQKKSYFPRTEEELPVLIVSDLDSTMVGHDLDPNNTLLDEFQSEWFESYEPLGSHLVYSTGRNKQDALALACEKGLPKPKMLVCGVGTEVYLVPNSLPSRNGTWAADPDLMTLEPQWTNLMISTFNRSAVADLLTERFPKIELRGNDIYDPYRIPSVYEVDKNFSKTICDVRKLLGPGVEVIVSGGDEYKLIDFCSSEAGKLKACQFVMERLGFQPEQTLVCGDSGNDESMYRCPSIRGVAVGNSLSELVNFLKDSATAGPDVVQKGAEFSTVFKSTVLYANRDCTGAITEALDRFWPTEK
eukprot:gnl/TRDRNA2_/TRDRNA2_184348_c0_seq1.p1 gnl/TRDRNA2_/TRDRNA2_184348_c0~~gnl/TRDRNA2_/TRDRNA2_184348_c0_seq1.p1  ORF type:complete len:437 (-),score=55.17 gnl/TRDRNA2_/TRDRNA2_184348_c0_seq1:167-1477(-)